MARHSRIWTAVVLAGGLAVTFACGSDKKDDEDSSSTTPSEKIAFSTVNAIIKKTCADASCHGVSQPGSTVFENNEANVKAISAANQALLNNGQANTMPKSGSGKVLSDADKNTILNFIRQ